ncbi:MAG: hypothetical protein E3J37_04300 [Anaerolineales bacterium]|nr:MAG: hypothetical protein E3J37_04300 [Anaerolineales bacterium]
MKFRANLVWAATAVGSGIFVLLGYFIDHEVVLTLRLILMRWSVLLVAGALFLGLFNLLTVHWSKVSEQEKGWPYSAVLILAFLVTLILGLWFGPDNQTLLMLFNYIQLPVEASLMALLTISLAVAGFRLVSRRRDPFSLIFVVVAMLVLLGTGPWLVASDSDAYIMLGQLRNWVAQVWASGGARGILLGVALGAILTGLRVLLAVDRPYGD